VRRVQNFHDNDVDFKRGQAGRLDFFSHDGGKIRKRSAFAPGTGGGVVSVSPGIFAVRTRNTFGCGTST